MHIHTHSKYTLHTNQQGDSGFVTIKLGDSKRILFVAIPIPMNTTANWRHPRHMPESPGTRCVCTVYAMCVCVCACLSVQCVCTVCMCVCVCMCVVMCVVLCCVL